MNEISEKIREEVLKQSNSFYDHRTKDNTEKGIDVGCCA